MKDEKAVVKIPFFPYNIHVMVFWDFPGNMHRESLQVLQIMLLSTEMTRGKNGYTGKIRSI